MTYGVLPTREEFDAAFEANCGGHYGDAFAFGNDSRVGTCELTCSELWAELTKAQGEWRECTPACECDEPRVESGDHKGCWEAAGQWCSDVLGVLGFEWV